VTVIGILSSVTAIVYTNVVKNAKDSALQNLVVGAGQAVTSYYKSHGEYPSTLASVGVNNSSTVSLQYSFNSAGTSVMSYCVTATDSSVSPNITYSSGGIGQSVVSAVVAGPCAGHTGTIASQTCPSGYIPVPGNAIFNQQSFCVMKYEAKNDGSNNAVSTAAGTIWVNISQADAITKSAAACTGCHLITEAEWMIMCYR